MNATQMTEADETDLHEVLAAMAGGPVTRRFLEAGHAIFTARSQRTGQRYTFLVRRAEPTPNYPRPGLFVNLLAGPDNNADYVYLGKVDERTGDVIATRASRMGPDSPPFAAARWVIARLWNGLETDGCDVYHEGRCGRCGRRLTVPESIESGIGPECARIMGE